MPSDRDHRYDAVPPIPTYDEAMANGGAAHDTESQSLLASNGGAASASSSRRPNGYRPPTVESDDEISLLGSGDDDDEDGDETAQVRREMQELEIGEPEHGLRSTWAKRIPFSWSLPRWKWSWRPRLPNLRRTIQLPSGPGAAASSEGGTESEGTSSPWWRRCTWPKFNFSMDGMSGKMAVLIVARIVAVIIVLGFIYLLFISDVFNSMARRLGTGLRFNPDDVRHWVQGHIEPEGMRASMDIYTSYAHVAGTEGDYALAMNVQSMFHKAGLDSVHVDEYYAYVNYPKMLGRAVEIMGEDGKKATWKAKLEENDPGSELEGMQTLSFHGHSKSGDVKGPLVYANYGSREDFQQLKDQGVDTKGAIALVRYYGPQRDAGLKVKAAEMAGFAGCLIYSDPADDGFRKGDVAPLGRFMPEDGVQRASVSYTNMVVGDVLTPGWPSKDGTIRMKVEQTPALSGIPSLPLPWRDAKVLLQHLKGKGEKVAEGWKGGVPDVEEWWTGDASSSPTVRLKNEQDEESKQPIWNIYGKIEGVEQSRKSIILGNARDSMAFGATGPHSGTAIMIELARVFGILMSKGWRPLRTIEFMSWDGKDYNMIGSTEYVEANVDDLRRDALAYVNLDAAVAGDELHVSGSPVFADVLRRSMGRVSDPIRNVTLKELWDEREARIEPLDSDGDWVAFRDIAGTSSLDLGFRGEGYPRHSSYDNAEWMKQVGDPGFAYHATMAELVALIVLELADRPVMPFDLVAYGDEMDAWTDDLNQWIKEKKDAAGKTEELKTFNADQIKIAVNEIKSAAKTFSAWENVWEGIVRASGGWESTGMNVKRIGYNNQMADSETVLLDLDQDGGIPNRTQFRHSIFGPELWPGPRPAFFPSIRDSVEAGEWDKAATFIKRTSERIRRAAKVLLAEPETCAEGCTGAR